MKRLIKYILLTLTASLALGAASCNKEEPSFTMQATVLSIDDKIEVDVTEAEYASGLYWIITGERTEYYDKCGNKLARSDINVGNTIIITYNGQVMMSYPAQVVALNIVVID
jgi:hypothetical protein